MNEEWKVIKGFENYEISNMGRVKLRNGKITYGRKNNYGYLCVDINRKQKLVSRLVAEAFIPNPENLATVNHKNEIKTDNSIDNLEWMSIGDNSRYSFCGIKRKPFTEEHLKNMSLSHKGQIPWNKGKNGIYSEETLKKIGDSSKGRKHSEETKLKMSEYRKCKKHKKSESLIEYSKNRKRNEKGQFICGK